MQLHDKIQYSVPPNAAAGNWRAYYAERQVTAEQALTHVKHGNLVAFTNGRQALALGLALAARAAELRDLTVYVPAPARDFGWYDEGAEEYVQIQFNMNLPVVDRFANERRADCIIGGLPGGRQWPSDVRRPDVILAEISPPDANGFCSFGASLWSKRKEIAEAPIVLAEVNKELLRTYGENFAHVTEFDYFVEHPPSGKVRTGADLLGRETLSFPSYVRAIGEHVSTLIHDGDTLQIGVGTASEPMATHAGLDQRNDLGWHSEATPAGIIRLIMKGNITGERKTLNRGVAVATAIGGGTKEEMDFVNMNPKFALYANEYTNDPRVIAAHDNMVAINNALAIDLTGQIAAETIGHRIVSIAGGQPAFAVGAHLSRNGRNVTLIPALTSNGLSRIVPALGEGTAVTVPRTLADIVVTEFGIARLRARTFRERAEALIEIAHPDHRAELRRAARKLFWPS